MKRPKRPIFVSGRAPHERQPSVDPPETRHPPVSYQKERRGASRRTETADRNTQTCRVTDSPPVEDFHIRIDDRFRVRRLTARGIGMIGNPSRRPERKKRRQDVAFHCKVENDDNPAFAAGTQGGRNSGRRAKPSLGTETGASETFTAAKPATPNGYRRSASSRPPRADNEVPGAGGQTDSFARRSAITPRSAALPSRSVSSRIASMAALRAVARSFKISSGKLGVSP